MFAAVFDLNLVANSVLCYIVQLSFKVKSQLYSGSMDVNIGSEIYTVELGDKRVKLKKEQLTTNALAKIFDIFPDTSILISDDGLLQQTVRVSLKTWMIYQYGHARELLVIH